MELAKDIAFFSLMAWASGIFIRAFVCFNFEEHFNGVRFLGMYLVPSRKYFISEITHTGVRRTMAILKVANTLSASVFLISASIIIVLKTI